MRTNPSPRHSPTASRGAILWYLSESLVPLAFFDESLSLGTKRAMIEALSSNEGSEDLTKRAAVDLKADLSQKTLADFVTKSSRTFFVIMGIDDGFLKTDPEEWQDDPRYGVAAGKVSGIRVLNDFAERAVALMEDYNLTLTKDEEQTQYILQVVETHRERSPTPTRAASPALMTGSLIQADLSQSTLADCVNKLLRMFFVAVKIVTIAPCQNIHVSCSLRFDYIAVLHLKVIPTLGPGKHRRLPIA